MADKMDCSKVQETLEKEFCPPLETTLIAALIADYIEHEDSTIRNDKLDILRDQLRSLANSAATDQLNELAYLRIDDVDNDDRRALSSTDTPDSDSLFDTWSNSNGDAKSSSGSSLPSRMTSSEQHASAYNFLRASFPDLAPNLLKKKLENEESCGEIDMEKLVEELLTEDYIKELEESGLENENEIIPTASGSGTTPKSPRTKKSKKKGKTIVLNDIRQQNQAKAASTHAAGDPWSQVQSISSYLESLLLVPSTFFSSYFHKPQFATPSDALRAALKALSEENQSEGSTSVEPEALIHLLEFLDSSPEYRDYDDDARAALFSDAGLVFRATNGLPDVSLDVLRLLCELETDKDGSQEMGLYHSPVSPSPGFLTSSTSPVTPSRSTTTTTAWTSSAQTTRILKPAVSVPAQLYKPSVQGIQPRPPPAPNEHAWQLVKPRSKKPEPNTLAAYIPAYNAQNVARRNKNSKAAPPPPTSGASSRRFEPLSAVESRREVAMGGYRMRIDAARDRRYELLRTASRHWAGGSVRSRGGEVALYYAMEAQRHHEEAHRLQLEAAREFVNEKRRDITKQDTLDLHYCTVSESQVLAREVLYEGWVSPSRPLHIITGRGTHSRGGVSVIQQSLKKTLENEGWNVVRHDVGLIVRGKKVW